MRIILGVWVCVLAQAQPFLNLDFEVQTRGRLRGWGFSSAGYEIAPDPAEKVSGNTSARIRNSGGADGTLGVTAILLPLDQVRGKSLRISGYIKTQGVVSPNGYAAIWLRVDGDSGFITLDNMNQTGPRGDTEWTRYEYAREVSTEAVQVVFGFFLAGRGTAWWDDLRIEVDGEPIAQGPEPFVGEPSPEPLEWIRGNSLIFRTPNPASGFDDLQPLKELIGDARIVGLGEATHGTSEFFRMKHRVVEFLASEMGFTIFNIEANMPEAYRVNDYVLAGRGDPRALLRGMYFWTWNTQEVLEMIEWMRRFNAGGQGRIQFTGNDLQTWNVAGSIVQAFVDQAEPGYAAAVREAYRKVGLAAPLSLNTQTRETHEAASAAAREVREHLEQNAAGYLESFTLAEVDWAVQNARVVEQAAFLRIGGGWYRDEMMARNTRWVLEQNPGAKMALWAHNYHVSRVPRAQGSYLAEWYGGEYAVLGFAFHEGRFSAISVLPNGAFGPLQANTAAVSFPGSVEYMFHQTGLPRFILDLRKAKPDNAGSWLLGEMEFREIGAVAVDGFAVRRTLAQDYDALIFFDQTTPTALLPFQ